MGLRLPGLRADRVPPVVKSFDMEETCGSHVINGRENSRLSLHVQNGIRFGDSGGRCCGDAVSRIGPRALTEGVPNELFSARFLV